MKYYLIPKELFDKVSAALNRLVPLTEAKEERYAAELKKSGIMPCYSNVVPMTKAFVHSIQNLTPIGINEHGLPCDPKNGFHHYLLPADSLPYLNKALSKLGEAQLPLLPWLEAPNLYTFHQGADQVEIEHWEEEQAKEHLTGTTWLHWSSPQWSATRTTLAIGSIINLPSIVDEDYHETLPTFLDIDVIIAAINAGDVVELPLRFLDMNAVLAIEEQLREICREDVEYFSEQVGDKLVISRRTAISLHCDEIPF